jgi:hypothetical protein
VIAVVVWPSISDTTLSDVPARSECQQAAKSRIGSDGERIRRAPLPHQSSGGTSVYTETDTGNVYAWDGSSWLLLNSRGGGGGTTAYDPVIEAIRSVTHYFPCDEAPGATSLTDKVGALTGLNLNGNCLFGVPRIVFDGASALALPVASTGDYITRQTPWFRFLEHFLSSFGWTRSSETA